jgi:uroporphyrinogen-III decarboxylase
LKELTAGKERDMKKMESFKSITARQLVEADKDVEKLKHAIFKESQALHALLQEEKNLTAEIRSTQVRVL